jgi:hypothetical protein
VSDLRRPGRRLRSRYGSLAPDERFRAALEAAARDDLGEREALVATCPEKTYRMPDVAFLDRVDASRDLAFAVAIELGPRLAEARMLDATRKLLLWVQNTIVELLDDEPDSPASRPPFATILHAIEQCSSELRSQEATVFEAFGAVCRDQLGLDPQTVLRAHLGELHAGMLGLLDQLDGAKPDNRALREWREMFASKWRERIG